jgi:very-short-patch-repair endonuclease
MIGIRHDRSETILWLTPDHRVLGARRVIQLSEHGGWSAIPIEHFQRARDLRRDMTPPERKLWRVLRGEQFGVKFRRQHPIGPYIADFYARDAGLVIEVDGSDAHGTVEAAEHDRVRDEYMHQMGLHVLRFTASDVDQRLPAVAQVIDQACAEQVLGEQSGKQWVYARNLQLGDTVYAGVELQACQIVSLERCTVEEEVCDLEVEGAHSFITQVCAVHNCGSSTTTAVAEKLNRRWIACDPSRCDIHTIRERPQTDVCLNHRISL